MEIHTEESSQYVHRSYLLVFCLNGSKLVLRQFNDKICNNRKCNSERCGKLLCFYDNNNSKSTKCVQ